MPKIRIFTTDACGYCVRAKRLLDQKGVDYEEIYFPRHDLRARHALVELTGRYTAPQVIVDDRPIGGWDDLKSLDASGQLDQLIGVA